LADSRGYFLSVILKRRFRGFLTSPIVLIFFGTIVTFMFRIKL